MLGFLLMGYSLAVAQPPGRRSDIQIVDMQADAINVKPTQALIWEIRGPGLNKPSYIYGLLHMVPANWFFLPPYLNEAANNADKLVLEVDPTYEDMDLLYRGEVPMDSTLDALIPKRKYQEMQRFFRDSLSALALYKLESRYKPLRIAQQMMSDFCLGYLKPGAPVNYEQYLLEAVDKPLISLKSDWAREQELEELSIKEQTEILMFWYENRTLMKKRYQEYMRIYRRQDLDALTWLAPDIPDFGGASGKYIAQKNELWLETLIWQMKRESLLIAVDAAQLPGEQGLLHLLRKAGYQLQPYRY